MRSGLLMSGVLFSLAAGTAWAGQLAPTGTLRAAFLAANPVQAKIDARTGEVSGPVADLVRELASRLKVPHVFVHAPNARAVIDHLSAGTADVGFLAYEEQRAKEVDYAAGFLVMFSSFLVPSTSALARQEDVDRPGRRIGAVRGQTQQIYLSAAMKQARVVVFDGTPPNAELARVLASGELDAFGLNQQRIAEAIRDSGGRLRMVPGSFLEVEQRVVVKKGEQQKVQELNRFVEELRTSGFLQTSIDRAGLVGVAVPPPPGASAR